MIRLILRRLVISIPLVLVVTLISFVLLAILPGSAATSVLGTQATPEKIAAFNKELGLDKPLAVQYFKWLGGVLHGDLGQSLLNHESVSDDLNARLPVTFSLVFGAIVVAVIIGVLVGVLTARSRGFWSRIVDILAVAGLALPSFWLALLLILVFAVTVPLLPATGYVPFLQSPSGWALSLVLPIASLAIGMITNLAKQTRDSMLDVLSSPYIVGLRANGISEGKVILKHALRNAAIPIVTVVGLLFVGSLTGAVVAEQIFVLPGLGTTVVSATSQRDIPMIQGAALYLTLIVVFVNILIDLAYGWLNPKVRKR
jgi:peptide/nickel transport system permease protein